MRLHHSYLPIKGFTLIELMVVLGIIGILAAFAAPSFQEIIARNAVKSASNQLARDIAFTRSEALKRGHSVTICNANPTWTACATATDQWQNGWIVFLDRNANSARSTVLTNQEDLIRVQQQVSGDLIIKGSPVGAIVKSIRFDRSGGASPTGITVDTGPSASAAISAASLKTICIATTGEVRATAHGVATCT